MGGPEWQNCNARWRMAAILLNVGNAITRPPVDRFGRNLGGNIPSCPRHVRRDAVAMKFGMQQQIRTAMTVMRSNIKIFKIQNGGRPPCWKIFEMS